MYTPKKKKIYTHYNKHFSLMASLYYFLKKKVKYICILYILISTSTYLQIL